MKKITSLQVQKRNPNRVNVHLDGEFAFGLSRIVAAWLTVGQELSAEKIAGLQEQDAAEVALQRSLRFLSYRPRSEKEMRDYLAKHDTPEAAAEQTLDKLRGNGMVDDRKFVRLWLENRSAFRPRGPFALRVELRQKGIDDRLIEEALSGLDTAGLAYRAGQTKARKLNTSDPKEFRTKMYAFLSRRGFDYEIIAETVRKLWQEK